jgi:hypothetical protein
MRKNLIFILISLTTQILYTIEIIELGTFYYIIIILRQLLKNFTIYNDVSVYSHDDIFLISTVVINQVHVHMATQFCRQKDQ